MIKVNAIQCPHCLDIIYSKAHYDYHHCACGDCMVDGGKDCFRFGYKDIFPAQIIVQLPKETWSSLYDDWNKKIDKLGVIHTNKVYKNGDIIKAKNLLKKKTKK
jgi:hypothetical protein